MPRSSRLLTVVAVPRLPQPVAESCPGSPRRMVRLTAAVLTAAALVGCGGGVVDAPLAVQPPAPAGPSVPDVVGKPLDVATSALDVAGFTGKSQDLLRDREQFVDGNWVVCTQDPGPVPTPAGAVVELGVVKDVEWCPGSAPTSTAAPTTTLAPTSPAAAPAPAPDPEPVDELDSEPTAEDEATRTPAADRRRGRCTRARSATRQAPGCRRRARRWCARPGPTAATGGREPDECLTATGVTRSRRNSVGRRRQTVGNSPAPRLSVIWSGRAA